MHESTHHARAQLGIPCDSRTRPARVRVPFSLMQLIGLLPSFKRENVYLQHAGQPGRCDDSMAEAMLEKPADERNVINDGSLRPGRGASQSCRPRRRGNTSRIRVLVLVQ